MLLLTVLCWDMRTTALLMAASASSPPLALATIEDFGNGATLQDMIRVIRRHDVTLSYIFRALPLPLSAPSSLLCCIAETTKQMTSSQQIWGLNSPRLHLVENVAPKNWRLHSLPLRWGRNTGSGIRHAAQAGYNGVRRLLQQDSCNTPTIGYSALRQMVEVKI
jgi:hypothetical protein